MNPASPSPATRTTSAPQAPRPVGATIRRERLVSRHELSPVKHSAHQTVAAIGLLWVAAAASTARAATHDLATLVDRGRGLEVARQIIP